jgi:16S rRNA (uracil1498-N3)-methyltransferase
MDDRQAIERPRARLFVEDTLACDARPMLAPGQAHYLSHVLRLGAGATVALFNGRDGEWQARITEAGGGRCAVVVERCVRAQCDGADLWLVFAPVKRAPIALIAAKATELGVAALWPVFTRHTAVSRVNVGRLRANAIEAAEQCGRLDVPAIIEPVRFAEMMAGWPPDRRLVVCDETGRAPPIAEALSGAARLPKGGGKWALLVGPEGGFTRSELDALGKLPFVTRVGLGPRILRADTAALAGLACWQAIIGDWRQRGEPE